MVIGNPFNESFNFTNNPDVPGSNCNDSVGSDSDKNSPNTFVHISSNTYKTSEDDNTVKTSSEQNYNGVEELIMLGFLHTLF